ncbi:hypothetical protein JCM10450v2_001231 [Rhodotorula kratochvilovae]
MVGGHVIPLERAVYCANPDAVATCIKICAAADQVSIGVRLGSYLQAVSYFILVLVAPDEGGAESMWLGLSISFSFLAACYIQLYLGSVTLHHTVIITLLSHLPYISTLAGMNTLTSYEVLGPAGVRFLQGGMVLKSVFTALLWAMCLFAWFVGQLPSWTHLQFRQANCFSKTSLVVWLFPVAPEDGHPARAAWLIATYSAFWFLVLCLGSYWTLIAPRVLLRRGGHLRDPKKKKVKGFPVRAHRDVELEEGGSGESADERRRAYIRKHPEAYKRDEDDGIGLAMMTMRSISKSRPPASSVPLPLSRTGSSASLPSYRSSPTGSGSLSDSGVQASRALSPPPATTGMTALSPWSKGLRGSDREAAQRWTRRQWPLVALLLVFVIVTTELQMVANDVYEGEMELDFPGALTLALAIPTLWAVAKSVNRIREGRRPTPLEREDKTFWEMASAERAAHRRRKSQRQRERARRRANDSEEEAGSASDSGSASEAETWKGHTYEPVRGRGGRREGR